MHLGWSWFAFLFCQVVKEGSETGVFDEISFDSAVMGAMFIGGLWKEVKGVVNFSPLPINIYVYVEPEKCCVQ